MSDISIEKQENNNHSDFTTQVVEAVYTNVVHADGLFWSVSGVCHDWQFDFDPCIGIVCTCVCTVLSTSPAFLLVGWGSALHNCV